MEPIEPVVAATSGEPLRPGLPWESGDGARSPAGAARTLMAVLSAPTQAFRDMSRTGGLGDPLLYLVLVGTVGLAGGLLWQLMARGMLAGMGMPEEVGSMVLDEAAAMTMLLLAPLFVVVGAALGAAIYHVMLLLFGGAPQPFETTFRVVCYASGSTYILQLLPLCGGIIAMIWALVATIIGLREAQGVSGARAAAAVLVPAALVCLCCALIWMSVVGMALAVPFAVNG